MMLLSYQKKMIVMLVFFLSYNVVVVVNICVVVGKWLSIVHICWFKIATVQVYFKLFVQLPCCHSKFHGNVVIVFENR